MRNESIFGTKWKFWVKFLSYFFFDKIALKHRYSHVTAQKVQRNLKHLIMALHVTPFFMRQSHRTDLSHSLRKKKMSNLWFHGNFSSACVGDLSIFVMLYDSLKRKDWAKMGLIISNHLACFLAIYALRKIALNRIHFGWTFSIQSQLKKLSH